MPTPNDGSLDALQPHAGNESLLRRHITSTCPPDDLRASARHAPASDDVSHQTTSVEMLPQQMPTPPADTDAVARTPIPTELRLDHGKRISCDEEPVMAAMSSPAASASDTKDQEESVAVSRAPSQIQTPTPSSASTVCSPTHRDFSNVRVCLGSVLEA